MASSSLALSTLSSAGSRRRLPQAAVSPPSTAHFPFSTKSGGGGAAVGPSHELTNPAVVKWRTRVSFFPSFLKKKGKSSEVLKEELLEAIAPLDRGAEATPEDQERVDQIASELEAVNSIKEPLKSDLLNGKWELLYTTSRSILQSQRPKFLRPNGKIYQAINADTLRAQNMETWPYFNQVTADLVPLNARRVAVKFDTFKIAGLIPIKAPGRARGELEITYLDKDLRYLSTSSAIYSSAGVGGKWSKAITTLSQHFSSFGAVADLGTRVLPLNKPLLRSKELDDNNKYIIIMTR